ncbi:endonuclease/exonuclease/phosphatase family protein [Tundrisphaera sp. TA3]|uniref:endonuclease/exonuclease/phosphatase family protein n=1 Tax=Tundrisphaera sp. TA3 TaxID=3435775 RepID=UPI003EBA77E1
MNPASFRVATINILNDPSRWRERRGLLAEGLAEAAPDLVALQEVTGPPGASTADWLAGELGGYAVLPCPKAGWHRGRAREGIAVLSRLPVERHEVLDLRGQGRTAQLVRVRVGGRAVALVNGHYYWSPAAHNARARQVGLVLDWLEAIEPGTPAVVCGDFNALPDSRPIARLREVMASAHEAAHGREPEATCPTPLVGGDALRSAVTGWLMRRFTNRPGESWRGVLDYIFAGRDLRVVSCDLFLDRPAPGDPGLYPSDHYGLVATLEMAPEGRARNGGGPGSMGRAGPPLWMAMPVDAGSGAAGGDARGLGGVGGGRCRLVVAGAADEGPRGEGEGQEGQGILHECAHFRGLEMWVRASRS